ncbi:hypothetical protein RM51_00330 [Chryseobacterium taiwanense]|uniref:Sugar-binding protein n=1 Tax=Chryseobacterium taiwanense TaxID=363331 RepID=A0A0B4D844_9FLAO|nr:hypothetical protein RM51_00330 [Chryseobacterium taiwanense]
MFSQAITIGDGEKIESTLSKIVEDEDNIKIPLYTIKVGNLTYPIEISYNISGIRVDDVASDIGLGWALTDSYINREVYDKKDVDQTGDGFPPFWNIPDSSFKGSQYVMAGHMAAFENQKGYQKVKNNNIIEHYNTNIGKQDYEPDIFNVYIPNNQTAFYYPISLNTAKELYNKNSIVTQYIEEMFINYTVASVYSTPNVYPPGLISQNRSFFDYKNFKVKLDNGIEYYFSDIDFVHEPSFRKRPLAPSYYMNQKDDVFNPPNIEKWHISKVKDPMTTEEINFLYENYTTEEADNKVAPSSFDSQNKPYLRGGAFSNLTYRNNQYITNDCYIFSDDDNNYLNRTYKRYIQKKRIKTIAFKNGTINFEYGLNRQDFKNGKALTRIEIRNKENKLVSSFDFTYSYFNSEQYRNDYSKRLKLESVTFIDGGKYSFEYYENDKIPQIGSFNKDFFGYCNTSNDDFINADDLISKDLVLPKYYYYPDKFEYSLLPYDINGQQRFSLGGMINKEPNDLAKTWSLRKVIYPTKGYTIYDLETNTFNLWGTTVKGPGVRIKSKTLFESTNDPHPRILSYNYNLPDGKSSGTLYNIPLVGYPVKKFFMSYVDDYGTLFSAGGSFSGEPDLYKRFFLYQNPSGGKAQIKYSLIEKNELDKKTVNQYETKISQSKRHFRAFYPNNGINDFDTHCISEFLYTNSAVGIDNTNFINHYLINSKLYEGNNIVKEIQKSYKNNSNKENINANSPHPAFFHSNFVRNAVKRFKGDPGYDYVNLIHTDREYFTRSNYLITEVVKEYLQNGEIIKTTGYAYTNTVAGKDPVLTIIGTQDGLGNTYTTNLFYATDQYTSLVNENLIGNLIGQQKLKNNNQLSFSMNGYGNNNSVFPDAIINISPLQNIKSSIKFDTYDDKGNLRGYRKADGTPVSIILGYNQSLPIAILEGISYNALLQEIYYTQTGTPVSDINDLDIVQLSNQDIDSTSEQILIQKLDEFRVNPMFDGYQCKITTFTYDTLIGVTSKTLPSGTREIYKYDSASRLERIEDKDGNVIKEYKYNYKQ